MSNSSSASSSSSSSAVEDSSSSSLTVKALVDGLRLSESGYAVYGEVIHAVRTFI